MTTIVTRGEVEVPSSSPVSLEVRYICTCWLSSIPRGEVEVLGGSPVSLEVRK